jgi:predicted metal-binding protein
VRLKCHYGCRGYGSHFCCPPFAPTPQETRQVLSEYRYAVLVRIQVQPSPDPSPDSARAHVFGYKVKLQKAVFELEKKAFLSGCRKMERGGLRARPG